MKVLRWQDNHQKLGRVRKWLHSSTLWLAGGYLTPLTFQQYYELVQITGSGIATVFVRTCM